ncbi:hypothetical protein FHG87_000028 [Trinorchestia longiramus]|nr:hypothetical protein FHG87_000028 [Trinorchestia longiramus]
MVYQRALGVTTAAWLLVLLIAAAAVNAQAQPVPEQTLDEPEGMESLPPSLRYLLVQRLLDARLAGDQTRPVRCVGCPVSVLWCVGCPVSALWCVRCPVSALWCVGCPVSVLWCVGCPVSALCPEAALARDLALLANAAASNQAFHKLDVPHSSIKTYCHLDNNRQCREACFYFGDSACIDGNMAFNGNDNAFLSGGFHPGK